MNNKHDEWQKDAARWRTALEKSFEEDGGADVVTHYKSVALAFPSPTSHASTYDYPRIDESALRAWASKRGWKAQTAPEMQSENDYASPPIRFTKEQANHPR